MYMNSDMSIGSIAGVNAWADVLNLQSKDTQIEKKLSLEFITMIVIHFAG